MLSILKKPYFVETSFYKKIQQSLYYSIFVFFFLYIFKPFGIIELKSSLLIATIGYSIICFSLMVSLSLLLLFFIPSYKEETWTVKLEIIWITFNIFIIGLGNHAFSVYLGIASYEFNYILTFEMYTLAIGVIPTTLFILINEQRLAKKYQTETEHINTNLDYLKINENLKITLQSETRNDDLHVNVNELLMAKVIDNYTEIYFMENNKTVKKILRSSLKNIETNLIDHQQFFRCHKSYVINLDKVERLSGNAQGYRLHLENISELVPVSRKLNTTIKERLITRP